MLNCYCYIAILETICVQKKWVQSHLKLLSTKYVYKSYLIYMYKLDLALNNLQRLICHKTQPNQTVMGFMWHKVSFKTVIAGLNSVFFLDWLSNQACLIIYPFLVGRRDGF